MRSERLNFLAHARTKDIVGRGLINNDNIAIIELIKNAKDAMSPSVVVNFKEPTDVNAGEIIIADEGSGMSWDDIQYKWLNIAYSEKKKSRTPRGDAYAGNKGIGRFSCDRLGKYLVLYTKTKGSNWVKTEIDWTKFEIDDRDQEIAKIKIDVSEITDSQFEGETGNENTTSGTILKISNLRNQWTKDKLVRLKKELERFVIEPHQTFEVTLKIDPDEFGLSGKVQNKIFEKLDFRTTSIHASTIGDGEKIELALRHDGDELFRVVERNPYRALKKVSASIYYLNQPAKAFFTRTTGYRSVEFGSVFLFLNGFRVFPYGDEGDDWLGIEKRKQQGQRRNLGTRELVGFIEVEDEDGRFEAVSSREGLVQNLAFEELASDSKNVVSADGKNTLYGFVPKLVAKLQKFVVEGLDWDRITGSLKHSDRDLLQGTEFSYLAQNDALLKILDSVITLRSPRKYIEDVSLNQQRLIELAKDHIETYAEVIDTLQAKFKGVGIPDLTPAQKRDLSKFIESQSREVSAKEDSLKRFEQQTVKLETENVAISKALKTEKKKRFYAESHLKSDDIRYQEILHHIKILGDVVAGDIDDIEKLYRENSEIPLSEVIDKIRSVSFETQKMNTLAKIITKSDFDLMNESGRHDFFDGVEGYLGKMEEINGGWGVHISYRNPAAIELVLNFSPIEQAILIDNILSNSVKAHAKNVSVEVRETEEKYELVFVDDGDGLTSQYSPEELFSAGITTTRGGSGTGLSNVKSIVQELEGTVDIANISPKGCKLTIGWGK